MPIAPVVIKLRAIGEVTQIHRTNFPEPNGLAEEIKASKNSGGVMAKFGVW
jgi:hypothetical protein